MMLLKKHHCEEHIRVMHIKFLKYIVTIGHG